MATSALGVVQQLTRRRLPNVDVGTARQCSGVILFIDGLDRLSRADGYALRHQQLQQKRHFPSNLLPNPALFERVVCVKFSNLTMVPGDAGGEPPVSVAAVAARWVNPLQLLEVELGNGLQLLRQPRCFEAGARRGIGPGGRSVLLQRPPNVAAAAGSAGVAPAAWARDTAEHAAAPGVRLGSSGEGRGAV